MDRCRRILASTLAATSMVLLPSGLGPIARAADPPGTGLAWSPADRDDLLRYARATWHSFEEMTGPDGLPADALRRDDRGEWKPSKRTTPTDIASYLWSALAARALGLIDDAEVDQRLGQTLATLGRIERSRGFYFNLYDAETGARSAARPGEGHAPSQFLSSVDNGWIAVALNPGPQRPARAPRPRRGPCSRPWISASSTPRSIRATRPTGPVSSMAATTPRTAPSPPSMGCSTPSPGSSAIWP